MERQLFSKTSQIRGMYCGFLPVAVWHCQHWCQRRNVAVLAFLKGADIFCPRLCSHVDLGSLTSILGTGHCVVLTTNQNLFWLQIHAHCYNFYSVELYHQLLLQIGAFLNKPQKKQSIVCMKKRWSEGIHPVLQIQNRPHKNDWCPPIFL